jgi:hypothetical protein
MESGLSKFVIQRGIELIRCHKVVNLMMGAPIDTRADVIAIYEKLLANLLPSMSQSEAQS